MSDEPRFRKELIRLACGQGDPAAIAELSEAVAGALARRGKQPPPPHPASIGEAWQAPALEERYREVEAVYTEYEKDPQAWVDGPMPLSSSGEISDSEAANYGYRMIKACQEHELPPPVELVRLLQLLLQQNKMPRGAFKRLSKGKVTPRMEKAREYLRENPSAKPAQIAAAVGVNRSTVGRWIEKGFL